MIAFFDVDQTLCACYSGYHTTRELIRRGLMKKRRLMMALFYNALGHLFKQVDIKRMYEIAMVDLAGVPYDEIMAIGLEIFETQVKSELYTDALNELNDFKSKGYTVALISSGPHMLIKNMEKFLQADFSFSNGPVIKDGILQKEIRQPICYQEGKTQLALALAQDKNTSLDQCHFYSDSYADLPLLEKVGFPVAVNPDRNLRRVAMERNWPIRNYQKTLGK